MDYMSFVNFYICAYYNHQNQSKCKNTLVSNAELTGGVANAELTGVGVMFQLLAPQLLAPSLLGIRRPRTGPIIIRQEVANAELTGGGSRGRGGSSM